MKELEQRLPEFSWTRPYTIPISAYREGFRAFQQKFVMHRNYVLMVLFALLLLTFIYSAVQTLDNKMQYFLMVLCVAVICLLWYNPRKQRRMILDAAHELEGDQYIAMCDGNVLRIQTVLQEQTPAESPAEDAQQLPKEPPQEEESEEMAEEIPERIPETRIMLETAWIREMETFYLVCDGKRMFYILPKVALSEDTDAEIDL